MIWYLVLSVLFSIIISLVVLEVWFAEKSIVTQCSYGILFFILSMLIWPLILVIVDGTMIWNTILRIRHGDVPSLENED